MAYGSLINERQLHLVWRMGWFRRHPLLLEDGRPLDVLDPGRPAGEGGPDFRAARLRIGGGDVSGDVELHLQPSGWRHHGHASDSAYAGVVLHVALHRDPFAGRSEPFGGGRIPELVLEPYLELSVAELGAWTAGDPAPAPAAPDADVRRAWLEELGRRRFERRRSELERLSRRLGRDEAAHRALLTALGYKSNKAPFAELARLVPWRRVEGRSAEEISTAYREAAKSVPWRVRCGRPANHPMRRLDGWIRIAATLRGSPADLDEAQIVAWSGGLIGADRADAMVVNALLPLRASGFELLAARHGPLPGSVRDACAALGLPAPESDSLLRQWGALEWLRNSIQTGPHFRNVFGA